MSKHVEGVKVKITFDPFNIHGIGWYGWKALGLSFLKLLQIENRLNIKKVMSKNVMNPYSLTDYTFDPFDMSKMSNITLYTVLHNSHKHHFQPFRHE